MIGAIVGDIAGSRFEFCNNKSKDFKLLVSPGETNAATHRHPKTVKRKTPLGEALLKSGSLVSSSFAEKTARERCCRFTDDTVMTLAVADALRMWRRSGSAAYDDLSREVVRAMQDFGRRYPRAGYGGRFAHWLRENEPRPYNSWGNGAAMRVSACGWFGRTVDEVKALSRAVTEVSHNHPEGIKGAEATSVAVFLARHGKNKNEIRTVVEHDYYPLGFTLDEIRLEYSFDVSCQGSVPQALEAFFESEGFEDAIRNAISIGGDSDTIAAICGAVAEAYYGVPDEIRAKTVTFLPQQLLDVLRSAEDTVGVTRSVSVSYREAVLRFLKPQETLYAQALEEVRNGCKLGHWIWYVFPQLRGLGHSYNSERTMV